MSEAEKMWSERWATAEGALYGDAPNAFLASQRALLQPGWRVLVPADGDGRNGVWLAEQGLDVVSFDISPVAREAALRRAAARGVGIAFGLADLATYDWPEAAYDAVVLIFTQFLGPEDRARTFAGIARTLRPGGLLLIEGYRPEQIGYGTGGPGTVENLYTEPMLRTAFADFAELTIENRDAVIEEGTGHRGLSALIEVIGRR